MPRGRVTDVTQYVTIPVLILCLLVHTGRAISCFDCYSLDGSISDCEDEFAPYNQTGYLYHRVSLSPYNQTGYLYHRNCNVGYLGFQAFYCIKIKGIKSDGHTVLIRTCSVTDWGSQCGDIYFEQGDVTERLTGCLATCDYDGCNGAVAKEGTLLKATLLVSVTSLLRRWSSNT